MQHIAMIMDGNRRWAVENKLASVNLGHKKGIDSVKTAVKFCLSKGIKYLSLYTFSLENFRRDESEKTYIFNLLAQVLKEIEPDLIKQGVRVRFVGDRDFFPEGFLGTIEQIEEKTKHLDKLNLNILFCYGSKQELAHATKQIAQKVKDGSLDIDKIDENSISRELWTNGTPDPEIIIRTGKFSRLSNFLLFQGAYSEWMFLDCHWPEIDEEKLQMCVDRFYSIKRNFGE